MGQRAEPFTLPKMNTTTYLAKRKNMNENILKDKKVSAISLGCDKNRVDLEKMLFKIKEYGMQVVDAPEDADIVIINTCAFISPAKKEAIDHIFEMLNRKSGGKLEKVIVSGCLSQRHRNDLLKQIPEVDAYLGVLDNDKICEIIEDLYEIKHTRKLAKDGRVFTNQGAFAYLKIAEGCSNACSYCTIPRIKGKYTSFPIEDLVDEAKYLAKNGIKELVLVAQDVSRYGEDLYEKNRLIDLLKKLIKIDGIEWIRLHYLYPEKTTKELLDFIKKEKKICKYVDIPLQHIDDKILSSMRRKLDEEKTRNLVRELKENYPEISVRTTFIVGYPGETRYQFKRLCDFVKESQFDYAGFFPYYREENTPSYFMDKQHSMFVKKSRQKKIQKIQNQVCTEKAKEKIGKTFKVLVDYFDESRGIYIGHSEFLSPSVDFGIEIEDNKNIQTGEFINVKFVGFDGYDFKGVYDESSKQTLNT